MKTIEIKHKGITFKVTERVSIKNGERYKDYVIVDYTSGKRVRHVRASLDEAKQKAKDIAEALASGKRRQFNSMTTSGPRSTAP